VTTSTQRLDLPHPIELGPFEIRRYVGRGAMGIVWQGVHREQRVPVAIKVLPHEVSRKPEHLVAFRDEVRRVAQFTHPGIVIVFDYGHVTATAAAGVREALADPTRADLLLEEGAPYLAMEFCDGASLAERRHTMGFGEIRATLLALLDALAHAHARGVVHRDIKPANILFTHVPGEPPVVKLTDFGIALALGDDAQNPQHEAAGTLPYMAPEQFTDWREQGPWTDLYALGCVAYELASGRRPFEADSPVQYLSQHLYVPPPALEPMFGVPAAFEPWVLRLLAKRPRDRFRCAADAAWSLLAIPDEEAQTQSSVPDQMTTLVFSDCLETLPFETASFSESLEVPEDLRATVQNVEPARPELAPIPPSWERDSSPLAAMSLVGAGMGLYEWRTVPLVGRHPERDRIWEALTRVADTGRAELVLLRGQAGYGKSRLSEWMGQRALEAGAVTTVLRAEHGPIAGPQHGLSHSVSRHLRCSDLDHEEVRARLGQLYDADGEADAYTCSALAELMVGDGGTGIRFNRPAERYAVLRRFLELEGADRPVMIVLEDIQWGRDALGFVRNVLLKQHADPRPVLFLATARDDILEQRPLENELLSELLSLDEVDTLDIGPLGRDEQVDLIRQLLRLEGTLAERVRKRTGGNPLFAVHLVGDWVRRGVLKVGKTGFELAPGEKALIPPRIHGLWQGRIEQVLAELRSEHAAALEIAAALGREVDQEEWLAACGSFGVDVPPGLVEALLEGHLAEPRPGGWTFCHGMMRESIQQDAVAAGRWPAVNQACARALRDALDRRGTAERVGRHLVEAGQHEASVDPLLEGVRESLGASEYRNASDLLDLAAASLRAMGVEESDPRWGRGWIARVRTHIGLGEFEDAARLAARTAEAARSHRWRDVYAKALRWQGVTLHKRGELGLAETVLYRAQMESARAGDPKEEAQCLLYLATIARMLGDPERATENAEQALSSFREIDDAMGTAQALSELGNVALASGDLDTARRQLREGLEQFERIGYPYGIAATRNSLGDIFRRLGELQAAEAEYLGAQEICERIGSAERIVPLINLGLLQLQQSHYGLARETFVTCLRIAEGEGRRHFQAHCHAALLACAAGIEDWSAWDRHVSQTETLIGETGAHDPDIASVAKRAGNLARAAGEIDRAKRGLSLALAQWQALGSDTEEVSVQEKIDGLEH
jgi:eukaryotic-like serine/threonine-protein kinase